MASHRRRISLCGGRNAAGCVIKYKIVRFCLDFFDLNLYNGRKYSAEIRSARRVGCPAGKSGMAAPATTRKAR